jgi:hypothetical protein
MLILKASEDITDDELINIVSQTRMYGIESKISQVLNIEELKAELHLGNKYNYVYLATHGNEGFFGSQSGHLTIKWLEYGAEICKSGILLQDSIILHSCCRGGLDQVAYELFYCCGQIQFICGPRQNVNPIDLITAFTIFLYNIEMRKIDPVVSAQKVLSATDIRLVCFDRLETVSQTSYQNHCVLIKPEVDKIFGFKTLEELTSQI